MKLIKYTAVAIVATLAVSAQASLISVVGGGDYPTSEYNDFFFDPLVFPEYNIGGDLYATEDINVTYTRIGASSGWQQRFYVDGSYQIAKGGPMNSAYSTVAAGSLFDFMFEAEDYFGNVYNTANGMNVDSEAAPYPVASFATALDVTYNGVFYDAIIMYDDTGGGDDDNHDDLVIGINVAKIPEPSVLLLMGLGLIGLFGARRQKS